jgi:hypothetical protein
MPSAALAAIDLAALRPDSDRRGDIVRSANWIHRPIAFHEGVPEVRTVVLLRTAKDPETGRYLVTSYTHAGLAFEADDFDDALRRAVEIVPDFARASGLSGEGIAIVLDEYKALDAIALG